MTSAIFQSDGKVEVPSEQLIISVIGPSITCRASLNTLALVLSGPGALFNGKRQDDTPYSFDAYGSETEAIIGR